MIAMKRAAERPKMSRAQVAETARRRGRREPVWSDTAHVYLVRVIVLVTAIPGAAVIPIPPPG